MSRGGLWIAALLGVGIGPLAMAEGCPAGVDPSYCAVAGATGGMVVACDAKAMGAKYCMDKFASANAEKDRADAKAASQKRAIAQEASLEEREKQLASMPEEQRQALLESERVEAERIAWRRAAQASLWAGLAVFAASFSVWVYRLGSQSAIAGASAMGASLLAMGASVWVEIGLLPLRSGDSGLSLVGMALPALACAGAALSMAKNSLGENLPKRSKAMKGVWALAALGAGISLWLLGLAMMVH